ncbi:MAG: MMPL family transporter [Magnetococcales bacterium]|nr:MMPL family transporter [Magnetococcales bacterium]
MPTIRNQIETLFANLGRWVFRRRYPTLVGVLVLMVGLMAQIGTLQMDTSNDAFYHPDDPAKVAYDKFRDRFGKDDHILIMLKPEKVFDVAFIQTLKTLREEIEQKVPFVREVTALDNVRHTQGRGDELIVGDLLEVIPDTPQKMDAFRQMVLNNPFYVDYLISGDGRYTALDLEPVAVTRDLSGFFAGSTRAGDPNDGLHYLSTVEYRQMMAALDPILARYRRAGMVIHLGGMPVVTDRLTQAVEQVMTDLTPVAVSLNILFLALLFRRISGVVYPILIVILTIIATLGAMAWLRFPINLVTSILPTLMTVVGVADAVHILSSFYREHARNGGNREHAISHAMGQNGLAILMTSITTAVGLASFAAADMAPMTQLGIAAPIGIGLAFLFTITLLPALIAIFPMKVGKVVTAKPRVVDRLLIWIADVSCRRYRMVLGVSGVLFLVALGGIMQLQLSHNALRWFPESSSVRGDVQAVDAAMGGTIPLEVVLDTGEPHGLFDPELMRTLDRVEESVHRHGDETVAIGRVNVLSTIIKESNRALHANQQQHYVVPDNRPLIAQEMLLFEMGGGDDLAKMVSKENAMTRMTIMLPFVDAMKLKPVVQEIRAEMKHLFPHMKTTLTGLGPMIVETMHDVLTTMVKSYAIALMGITALMLLLIGRVRIGLFSMIPNLLPIIMVMGVMGWMGLPFDFSNMLAGSVAIGLVVDDTIHFFHTFRRNFEQMGEVQAAVRETLLTTGRALFITSAVLAAGFAVAMFVDLRSTANFGVITASAVLLALLADFFMAPALMMLSLKQAPK